MAIRDTSVKYFDSTMTGAPVMSGTAGALIGVLDACLVNGFGSVVASSLVVVSGVATLTVSAGHGFVNPGAASSADVGIVTVVSGVTGALVALNKEWRVTVASTTVLTWECGADIQDGSASGSIAVKRAPAGWSKAFSGTNKAAYKSQAPGSTGCILRADNTYADNVRLLGYESMSDIDTGSGAYPSTGYIFFAASSSINATARYWRVIADGSALYAFAKSDSTNWFGRLFFGDFVSVKSPDAYRSAIISHYSSGGENGFPYLDGTTLGHWIARSYSGSAGAILGRKYGHRTQTLMGGGGAVYPNPPDNSLIMVPVELWEGPSAAHRGFLPGAYSPLHSGMTDGAVVKDVVSPGRHILLQNLWNVTTNAYSIAIDITKDWR